jgi:hypothetical protein
VGCEYWVGTESGRERKLDAQQCGISAHTCHREDGHREDVKHVLQVPSSHTNLLWA